MSECTCGKPNYPVIDLTPVMILFQGSSYSSEYRNDYDYHATCYDYNHSREILREQVYTACHDYGCFHVQLRNECPTCFKPLYHAGSLRLYNHLLQNIHSLFEENFLKSITDIETNHSQTYDIPIHRPLYDDDGDSYIVSMATFRGRNTESGSIILSDNNNNNVNNKLDSDQSFVTMEPKQSWELHRCTSTTAESTIPINVTNHPSQLDKMHHYIQVLHSIAACIVSPLILNLPKNNFLSENPCTCFSS